MAVTNQVLVLLVQCNLLKSRAILFPQDTVHCIGVRSGVDLLA